MDIKLKKRPWYVRYRYYLIAGIIFLAFTIYVIILTFGPHKRVIDSTECKIANVTDTAFMEYVEAEGIVQPIQTIKINALEQGFVERIVAEEGSMLNEGDTILILSNPALMRAIDDEQTEWANQQRSYKEQEIEMDQRSITLRQQALEAKHQMASLEKSLKQSREEFRMGIKSKAELEVIEEDYDYQSKKAKLQMQSIKQDSIATRLKQEMVHSNREATNKKLSRTKNRTNNLVVRASVGGQLSFLNIVVGQQVFEGNSIGEIKVMTEYKVHTSLSEYYIDRIATGLPANIQYQDKKYPLKISKIVPEVKERNFVCDLVFTNNKPENIRLGKNYRVQIELDKPEHVIIIPRGDFYQFTSGNWIYKLSEDGKTAHKVNIEIGRQNPMQYEIISGLKSGDKVIVSGYANFGEIDEIVIK